MAQPKKFLRIGVFQGKKRIEERILRRRETVSVGQNDKNTFVVLSSSMPKHHDLFKFQAKTGIFTLQLSESMAGRVTLKKGVDIDLTQKAGSSYIQKVGDFYCIDLSNSSVGRVTIGKTNILFQFVNPPENVATTVMASKSKGFFSLLAGTITTLSLCCLLISFLAHIVPLIYIMANDWPRNDDIIADLPDWYLKRKAVVIEEEEPEKPEEPEIKDAEGDQPQKEEVAEEKPQAPKEQAPKAPSTPAEVKASRELGRKIGTQMLAIDGDGTGDIFVDFANSLDNNSTFSGFEHIDSSDIGIGGAGLGAGLLGSAQGGPGEAGLKGLEGPNNGVITADSTNENRKVVKEQIVVKVQAESQMPSSIAANDQAAFKEVFSKNKKSIENCYKREIQNSGQKAGRVIAKIVIGTDGKVQKVEITLDEIGGNIAQCISGYVKKWKFGKPPKMVTVMQRWIFG